MKDICLEEGSNNACKCSVCGYKIPKEVPRKSWAYFNKYGSSHIRICGLCLIRLAKLTKDKKYEKGLKAFAAQVMVDGL